MPHKRNPIARENLTGLARLLRSNALAAIENVALWHERDISHSSVERIIFPDSCILVDYALARLTRVLKSLVVYPEHMERNLNITQGLIFSQAVLLELTKAGFTREQAYKLVQENAMDCWKNNRSFQQAVLNDKEISKKLTTEQIESCFDKKHAVRHVDLIFQKVGLL
mgnify:CR=1 FL=1